ncbi:MAG: exonuclease domain-containing protein [Candidatus Omnitrophica bacterium]|nr:exonuclease domain-containing protein [Candidatus Omnitrophota bacterium]
MGPDRNLEEIEFTIFDTETTGLDPKSGDRIIEIAAIRFKGTQNLQTFQSLINPGRQISEGAFSVHHINEEMLKDAPTAKEVLPQFLEFIHDTCLASYNAGFDLGFLNNELKIIGRKELRDFVVVDVLKMARRLLPGLGRYALVCVAEKLGIGLTQKHRALADVELTLEVFNKLKNNLLEKGIVDFNNFISLFGLSSEYLDNLTQQKVNQIQEAMDLGVRLKIKYVSTSGLVTERKVIPQEIIQENNRLYLVGHCFLRNDKRSFRIDSILDLEII